MNLQIFLSKVKKLRIAEQQLERLEREGTDKQNWMAFKRCVSFHRSEVDKMIIDIEKNLCGVAQPGSASGA
jgi:hypothetical protein